MDVEAVQALAIVKAGEQFDDWQDCTCDDPDEFNCWYRLTDEEKMDLRVQSVVERLEIDEPVVRGVLVGEYS